MVEHALEIREVGEYPEAIFYDVHFSDLVADPFGVVQKIYETFSLPMSEEAATRMGAFIEDNPQGKHGSHDYSPEEFGVDPSAVRREFRLYIERFALNPESPQETRRKRGAHK